MKRTPIQLAARVATYGLVLVVAAAVVLPWLAVADRDERIARLDANADAAQDALVVEQAAHDESVAYWRSLYEASFQTLQEGGAEGTLPSPDEADVDAPTDPDDDRGPTGPQGPGPTPAQIAAAVTTFCASGDCSEPPSVEQVSAAVATYCEDGRCVGAAGADGGDGTNGADGANGSDGAPGRAPTAEEVAAAVASYCASGACVGPQGQPGQPGPPGPVSSPPTFACGEDGRWLVTNPDGSTYDAGSCRESLVVPEPEPTPEPTPDPIPLLP